MKYTDIELQDFLVNLPPAQFADLMRRVFELKIPNPEEIEYNKKQVLPGHCIQYVEC